MTHHRILPMATRQRLDLAPVLPSQWRGFFRLFLAVFALWMGGCLWAQPGSSGLASGERRLVMSDGASIFVKVSGRGPICLFVHGGPGQGSLSFEKMGGDALEGFLTMVYVDQRGSGKSPDASNYHLERLVQDLEEVRKDLKQERVILLAHSFGGIIATSYARRFPERVTALIMANATLYFLGPDNSRMQIEFVNRLLGKTVVEIPKSQSPDTLFAACEQARAALRRAGFGYRFLTENLATVNAMSELDGSYPRSMGFGDAIINTPSSVPEYMHNFIPDSALIKAPVLIIAGNKDYAVGPDHHKSFRFPDQAVVTLEAGHLPYYENTQEFAAAIRGFVTRRLR